MSRRLVTTNEWAGHWMRQRAVGLSPVGRGVETFEKPTPSTRRWRLSLEDGQLFTLSFAAFFTAIYSFIA